MFAFATLRVGGGKVPRYVRCPRQDSAVEQISCLCTPSLHYITVSCEHAPRRCPSRVILCLVNHPLRRSCLKPLSLHGLGVGPSDLVSYLIFVLVCYETNSWDPCSTAAVEPSQF